MTSLEVWAPPCFYKSACSGVVWCCFLLWQQAWCCWSTCRVEREAFEQRLKERDDAKTRKLAEAKLSKEELADMERRKYKDEEEKMDLLPRLR